MVEFFRPVNVDGNTIPKRARTRVAHIIAELPEPEVVLVLLREKREALLVERRVITFNSIPVATVPQ